MEYSLHFCWLGKLDEEVDSWRFFRTFYSRFKVVIIGLVGKIYGLNLIYIVCQELGADHDWLLLCKHLSYSAHECYNDV